jgi:hypothetical protein
MELQSQTFDTCGTYNLDHLLRDHARTLLLPDGRADFFFKLEEPDMYDIGAPTCDKDDDFFEDKGYGAEWYFKSSRGNTVAVGFRWEIPRLRGDGRTTVDDVVELIDFLQSRLSED